MFPNWIKGNWKRKDLWQQWVVKFEDDKRQTLKDWQMMWDSSSNGWWTRWLLPSVVLWTQRKRRELSCFLTRVLTGHGCFGYLDLKSLTYQHVFRLEPFAIDDVEHTVFQCDAWDARRRSLYYAELGEEPTPDTTDERMLSNRGNHGWQFRTS